MAGFLGIANGFWIAAIFRAKLEGWGWFLTSIAAFAPTVMIGLGCLWAHLYDEFHSNPQR